MNKEGVSAVAHLIDSHNQMLGLEEGNGTEVDLWHILLSIMEFCHHHGIDFDSLVTELKAYNPELVCRSGT